MKEPAAQRGGDPRDPDYMPPMAVAIPLGIQHVMAMFVPNLMPAVVLATAAGFGYGSSDSASMIYMIQMAMVFSGLSTLLQTIGMGPVGARLPVVQGTNFAFIPLMIPVVKSAGMAALFGGLVIGGLFHFLLGAVVGRVRYLLPPLVTGIVLLMVSLLLIPIGIEYAAGGAPVKGTSEFGDLKNWSLALIVMAVTLALKFFVRGVLSAAAVLVGLAVGYAVGLAMGEVDFSNVSEAAWFMAPQPLHFGFEVNAAAVIGFCLMAVVSVIDTVGSVSGITKGGAGRQATVRELSGATYADGAGSTLAALFGGLPNTSYSQNVGLVLLTGVMSRHVVTIGAVFLVLAGLVPKVGAVVAAMPISVLGGGIVVMFGMVGAAGVTMLSDVRWNSRSMIIFAVSLSVGLGLKLVPEALQHLQPTVRVLLSSGVLPAAFLAIGLNALLPENDEPTGSARQNNGESHG